MNARSLLRRLGPHVSSQLLVQVVRRDVWPRWEDDARSRIVSLGRSRVLPLSDPHDATRPFFIIGTGRAGTTLLRRILMANPTIHIPPENHALGQLIRQYRRHAREPWESVVRVSMATLERQPDFKAFELDSLDPLLNRLVGLPPSEHNLAKIVSAFYGYHAEANGKPNARWGDKTPINTFHLDRVIRVFPHAKFVHLVRNPIDCIGSYLRVGRYSEVDEAIERYLMSVRLAKDFELRCPHSVIVARYEDLVADPEAQMDRICRFISVDFDRSMLSSETLAKSMGDVPRHAHHRRVFEPISSARVGTGGDLSPESRQRIVKFVGDEARRWGYELG